MPKKYKLLIDSPTQPKGMIATQEPGGTYQAHNPSAPADENFYFPSYIVENRPTVWQEIVEEPEKKIVERWRGKPSEYYYPSSVSREVEQKRLIDDVNYNSGDYFSSKEVCNRSRTRTEIMCRLMGLAETIEEGSTEMKGGYMLVSNDGSLYITHSYITYMSSMRLATFSTEKLAQLFLDSAGQDALDWYGEVK